MSSTKPTISARANALAAAAAAAAAALGVWVIVVSARLAFAEILAAQGAADHQAALALSPGLPRQDRLHRAQERLRQALEIDPRRADLWLTLAQVRLLQAEPQAGQPASRVLLEAALAAADRAQALQPTHPQAAARAALALARLGAPAPLIADRLTQSYQRVGRDPSLSPWRHPLALQAWSALGQDARLAALDEACFLVRDSRPRFDALATLAHTAADASLAAALEGVIQDAACRPPPQLDPLE